MNTPAKNAKNANAKNACNINIEKTPFGTVDYSELEKTLRLKKQGPGPVAQSRVNSRVNSSTANINALLGNPNLEDLEYLKFLELIKF